ncbi:MAG: N-acetylmuramoyl-L-alanine amidase [Candidatus Brocadiae bacterium]|nr:N-acetylmuramoyl-L-alanine amidase [Candidatus Brocadiia bacterium]
MFLKFFIFLLVLLTLYAQENKDLVLPASQEEGLKDIGRYVELFASKNALVSLSSLDYIAYFGKDALPFLIQGLNHANQQVRCFSAIALSRIPDKSAVAPLIAAISEPGVIDLQVLSDDGLKIHPAYDMSFKNALQENALRTLQSITGVSFGAISDDSKKKEIVEKWQEWWQKEEKTFILPQKLELTNLLSEEARYPIPGYSIYLKGITVCLDPGHGGESEKIGYKRGPSGNQEAESNLRLSRYLRDFLTKCGAKVLMTRDSDRFISLKDRTQVANLHKADLFISIHHNWSYRYTAQATTIWYHRTQDYKPAAIDLARYIFQEFTDKVPMRELDSAMGLKSDNLIYQSGFGVLRDLSPEIPGILCELAFFSNLETELKMRDPEFLRQEAYGIFLGVARYLYAGIPSYSVLEPKERILSEKQPLFVIQIHDGLQDRNSWDKKAKIFAKQIVVELDGISVPYQYNPSTSFIEFQPPKPLSPGDHTLQVFIMNLNKNHNWGKVYCFSIQEKEKK